jgi:hypothetical protein
MFWTFAVATNLPWFSSASPGECIMVSWNVSELSPSKSLTPYHFLWSLHMIWSAMTCTTETAEFNCQWTSAFAICSNLSLGPLLSGVSTVFCEYYWYPVSCSFLFLMWWTALFQVPDRKPAEWREQCWGIHRCIETGLPLCGTCVCLFKQHQDSYMSKLPCHG